jgi:hypothetical protein
MGQRIALHSRRFTWSALLAGTLLTGCTQWQVQDISPQQLITTEQPHRIRITRPDSSKVILSDPRIVGDTLYGTATDSRAAPAPQQGIPLGDIAHVSIRRGDPLATGVLIAVPAAALIGAALIIRSEIANID